MNEIWNTIKEYYLSLGEKYMVDPMIFVGIHIAATPVFLGAVAWLVRNKTKKKSLLLPGLAAFLSFNAANIYLVCVGRNIPLWVYLLLGGTTILSGWFSIRKIREKMHAASKGSPSIAKQP
ncbi:MAG: hypothetical protein M3R27_00735 [Bacteroidota bacterium]|nr:hypothetical protein [Bacteroidota bacterium]